MHWFAYFGNTPPISKGGKKNCNSSCTNCWKFASVKYLTSRQAQSLDKLGKKQYLLGTGICTLIRCPIRGSLRCHPALMRKESFPLCGLAEIDWSRKWVCGTGVRRGNSEGR